MSSIERRPNVEHITAVEERLMRKEQAKYYMSRHEQIGDQSKVVDNAMGPNISSNLFLTNALEIVAVDEKGFFNEYSWQYADFLWDFVDSKPIYRAGAFGYDRITPEKLEPSKEEWKLFYAHRADRWRRGYWDMGALNHWDIDRLLFLELKKMGVDRRTIVVQPISCSATEITFDWTYPGERAKQRKILYLTGTLDKFLNTKWKNVFKKTDCYLQKGLETDQTHEYMKDILPFMNPKAIFAIGHRFKVFGDNIRYGIDLAETLGEAFDYLEGDKAIEKMIDKIPDNEDNYEAVKRGIKLHIFRR
ncbi:TPA: hypothetical protein DIU27_05040 [Candidatus Collierbacteria bacterium]|nr:MAG: hypothetical protein UW64_C0008G0010 [Microgenomates group bacterium GW2011_GWC1_44_37]HCQ31712.1 hypothetical protein [Candidatus Collierbacteria bacterium]